MSLNVFELEFEKPFDITKCLTSGQVFTYRQHGTGWLGVDGSYVNSFETQTDPHRLKVHSSASIETVRSHLGETLDFTDSMREIANISPAIGKMFLSYEDLRMMRSHCPRSTIFSFVCTANNHLSRIYPMIRSLQAYGEEFETELHPELKINYFPLLEILAEISEEALRSKGFGYRAKWIPLIARKLLDQGGESALLKWQSQPYALVREQLMSLPGIGPKLADCICVFGFNKRLAFPIDTHVYQIAQQVWPENWADKPLTDARYRQLSQQIQELFGQHSALVSHIMFAHNLKSSNHQNTR